MKKLIKKYWFISAAVVVSLIVLIFEPQTEIAALRFTVRNFLNFLFMLTPVFICIGLIDIWIERDTMIKIMGKKSGVKGALAALTMGMITAVPLYALFPIAGVLLKKGSRISNVMLFLCSSAGIRIPLLLFEVSSLGAAFTFTRFALNFIAVFAMAFIVEKLLSEADIKAIYENTDKM